MENNIKKGGRLLGGLPPFFVVSQHGVIHAVASVCSVWMFSSSRVKRGLFQSG